MTTPTIIPAKYPSATGAYRICKADRSGAERTEYVTVTIPAATAAAAVVGLVPFRKGAMLNYGGTTIYTADLDTSTNTTYNIGYVYDLGGTTVDGVTYTEDNDAFASALSGQAAAFINLDEPAGMSWKALGDGWIAITLAGGPTTTEGAVQAQVSLMYDQ